MSGEVCSVGDMDMLYYKGANETFPNGDRVLYGAQVKVIVATTPVPDERVRVHFPNNADWVDCLLTELSRTKPPDEVRTHIAPSHILRLPRPCSPA